MNIQSFVAKTALAASVAAGLAVCGPVLAQTPLKTVFFISSDKSIFKAAFSEWVKKLNAEGKGLVRIDDVVGPESIPERQMSNALKNGLVDIVGAPPSYFSNLVRGAEGLSAANVTPAEQRKNGAYELVNEAFMSRANAYYLAQYGDKSSFHIFTTVPIKSIQDFKGMKLRTSNTYKAFFDALGAQPLQMSRGEIFTALERGVVQGYANLASEVVATGWQSVSKYRVDPHFYWPTIVVAVNLTTWKKLNPEQQAFLKKTGLYLEDVISNNLGQLERDAAAGLEKGGMQVSTLAPDDAKKFVDLAYSSTWASIEKQDPELGSKLRKLVLR